MSSKNWRGKTWKKPKLEDGQLSKWFWIVQGLAHFKMGRFTDIGAFTIINAQNGVTIEDEVQIGPHCAVLSASTIDSKYGPIVLKKNCRIGAGSIVMPNVTIGENAIVGALSFINRDIPADEVWAGCPIHKLK